MTVSQRASRLIFRLFSNWPAKALALGAAILLYLLVGLDSLEERYITVPVRLDLPPDPGSRGGISELRPGSICAGGGAIFFPSARTISR
jgi:hypothetical protein